MFAHCRKRLIFTPSIIRYLFEGAPDEVPLHFLTCFCPLLHFELFFFHVLSPDVVPYMYLYTCEYLYVYVHVCICLRVYMYTDNHFFFIGIHFILCVYACMYMLTCLYVYIYSACLTHAHVHIHSYTCVCLACIILFVWLCCPYSRSTPLKLPHIIGLFCPLAGWGAVGKQTARLLARVCSLTDTFRHLLALGCRPASSLRQRRWEQTP